MQKRTGKTYRLDLSVKTLTLTNHRELVAAVFLKDCPEREELS